MRHATHIRFRDDSELPYEPPKNTVDPRYAACVDHHAACDCREAEFAEAITEYQAEYRSFRAALAAALIGHAACCCRCTGCAIARAMHLTHLASGRHCRD